MISSLRKTLGVICLLLAGLCFWNALPKSVQSDAAGTLVAQATAIEPRERQPQYEILPIQEIRPGMRIPGRNPDAADAQRDLAEPDPATWKLLHVVLDDGEKEVTAELLRPDDWLQFHQVVKGTEFWLDLPEMEAAGAATVLDVLRCPPIEAQSVSGVHESVVTGTFRHTAMSTVELSFEASKDGAATTDTLVCTPQHPFWSADRHEFVAASELQSGESIQTADDSITRLTSIVPRAGPCEVYGLEVFGEHVYFAGEQGLLVHNASGRNSGQSGKLYRYVGEGEARIIRRSGVIPSVNRQGAVKDVYVTDRLYKTAGRAKTHLQLPEKSAYRIEIDPSSISNRTPLKPVLRTENPQWGIGGGTESITRESIRVDPSTLTPLKGSGH